MTDAVVAMRKVGVTFTAGPFWDKRNIDAVRNVDLDIAAGETLGLVGESGSGKTTVGRLLLGQLAPTRGEVLFLGKTFPEERRARRQALAGRLSVVLQQPEWALNPRLRVGASVAEPLAVAARDARPQREERAVEMLQAVGLNTGFASRFPHELSGGQRQRVAVARALITEPKLIVFDEPVSALDVSVQVQILNLIRDLQQRHGFAALFVSHDLAATRYVSARIAVMRSGELLEVAETARFYDRPHHAYSQALWQTAATVKKEPVMDAHEDRPERGATSQLESTADSELRFDFPELRVGIAEYEAGPTGCTVLYLPDGADCAVDVRGGSPGLLGDYPRVDAICLAGGSLYGLEAVSGVAAGLLEDRGGTVGWGRIAVVSGAIIYDFGGRDNAVYPDKALGLAAYRAAHAGVFPLGARGAGRSASVGKFPNHPRFARETSGQGAAFARVGGARVFVATVVNAIGVVVDRRGRVVRGLREVETGLRWHPRDVLASGSASGQRSTTGSVTENTTLTVLVTDQPMSPLLLRQLARQVHSSMARVIQPFHTPRDGDILFALSTGTHRHQLDDAALAEVASDLAWDAVLSAVGHREAL